MAVCDICKTCFRLKSLNRRLAIPEYRSMIGIWPWIAVRVCDGCLEAHDRDFLERLRLLAPGVLENDEPVTQKVCLACGTVEPGGPWHAASKWVDAAGTPVRRARFHLCHACRDAVYVDGVVVASNLAGADRVAALIAELPSAGADLLDRVEGWRPSRGDGPEGAADFRTDLTAAGAAEAALAFWSEWPDGAEARGAWLGPVRKDYRMRYRLDLARDAAGGRRETLAVVRTGDDRFAVYRIEAEAARA